MNLYGTLLKTELVNNLKVTKWEWDIISQHRKHNLIMCADSLEEAKVKTLELIERLNGKDGKFKYVIKEDTVKIEYLLY